MFAMHITDVSNIPNISYFTYIGIVSLEYGIELILWVCFVDARLKRLCINLEAYINISILVPKFKIN